MGKKSPKKGEDSDKVDCENVALDSSDHVFETPKKHKKSKKSHSSQDLSAIESECPEQCENVALDSSDHVFETPKKHKKSKKSHSSQDLSAIKSECPEQVDNELSNSNKKHKKSKFKKHYNEHSISGDDDPENMDSSIDQTSPRKKRMPSSQSQSSSTEPIAHDRSSEEENENNIEKHNSDRDVITPKPHKKSRLALVKSKNTDEKSKSPHKKSKKRSADINDDDLSQVSSPKKARKRSSNVGQIGMRYDPPDHLGQLRIGADVPVSKEDLESDDVQLYLCQIPRGLEIGQLEGKSLKFDGSSIICKSTPKDRTKKRLEIRMSLFSQQQGRGQYNVLATSEEDGQLHTVNKRLCGQLTVTESIELEPYVLPPPRPKISVDLPEGLIQRYVPFGASQPVMSSPKKKKKEKKKKNRAES